MTGLTIAAVIIIVLIVIVRINTSFKRYKAALNCLMARQAFALANDDLKATAVFRSLRVLQGMGFSDPQGSFERMSDVEKCSVLALAFAELHVPPPFKNETWQFVRRPLIDILNARMAFAAASRHLKATYGVDMGL